MRHPWSSLTFPRGRHETCPWGSRRKVVWSPDSTRVACNADSDLLTISAEDGRIQEVVSDDNIKDVSWGDGNPAREISTLHKR